MGWKRSDVEDGASYCIGLCVNESGFRDYVLINEESGTIVGDPTHTPIVAETQTITCIDALKRHDYEAISSQIKLKDGRKFSVDAHGIWRIEGESLSGVRLPPK